MFRLLARQYNYYPTNVEVQLAHDWVVDNYVDLFDPLLSAIALEKDPAVKAQKQEKMFGTQLPTFMNQVCKYIKGPGRWLFGDKICAADFMVGRLYTDYMCDPMGPCHDKFKQCLSNCPEFERYGQQFAAEMADYLAKRPKTPF